MSSISPRGATEFKPPRTRKGDLGCSFCKHGARRKASRGYARGVGLPVTLLTCNLHVANPAYWVLAVVLDLSR